MDWRVALADLDYDAEEEQAVLNVVRSRWLTMAAVTQQFESEFAQFVGAKHALAVSNATVALHLACCALNIGHGDEVIGPALTFVATANAVLYTGADVRFADVSGAHDLNISPADIERQITPRTRAITVVHYGGFPCQMTSILDIAARHHLSVIEDAAHAPGAWLGDKALGTIGDIGCFSFFSNKNLSTGEGGMIVTQRDDLAEKIRLMRSHGMTTVTWDRHRGHAYTYDVVDLGYNYRIDEIRSALGLAQLHKLARGNARRHEITETYWRAFESSSLELPFRNTPGKSAHHLFPILLPQGVDRLKFIDSMRAEGIQTSIHYPPIHHFSYYTQKYPGISLPITESVSSREVTLPLYGSMPEESVDMVIAAVYKSLDVVGA